jgi:hypothetical protein
MSNPVRDCFHMTEKNFGRGLSRFRMRIHLSAQIRDPNMGLARSTEVRILKTAGRDILLTRGEGGICNEKKGVIELILKSLANSLLCCSQTDLSFHHAISQTTNNLLLDLRGQPGWMKITCTGKLCFAFPNCLVFYMGLNSIHSPLLARDLKDSRSWYAEIAVEAI